MAIDLSFGGLDNEYIGQAEQARKNGASGKLIKTLLQAAGAALGISHPVANEPPSTAKALDDLGKQPMTQPAEITNDKGDVVGAVEVASKPSATAVNFLPMSRQPHSTSSILEIDPSTGLPWILGPDGKKPQ